MNLAVGIRLIYMISDFAASLVSLKVHLVYTKDFKKKVKKKKRKRKEKGMKKEKKVNLIDEKIILTTFTPHHKIVKWVLI